MKKILITLLAMLGINACVASETGGVMNMNVKDFSAFIANPDVQLIDVRTPGEYAAGHISGARNIDVTDNDFVAEAGAALDKSRPVAVYCRSGRRSAEAAGMLESMGYAVTNLEGGIVAWTEEGRPVELPKGAPVTPCSSPD